jgi:cytochrome P450
MDTATGPRLIEGRTKIEDYADILEILKSPSFAMVRGIEPPSSHELMSLTLATLDGQEHFKRRRIESNIFRNDALTYFEQHALRPIMRSALGRMIADADTDGVVRADLVPLMLELLHKVSAVVSGLDDVDTPERGAQLARITAQIGPGITVEWVREGADEVLNTTRAAMAELQREFVAPSLERRRALVAEHKAGKCGLEALPRDVLTMLLLNWEEHWDDEVPLREIALYLVGSVHSTSRLSSHILEDLWTWKAKSNEIPVDAGFLGGAAAESLRMHAALPALMRRATAEVVLPSGRVVQPGEYVALEFGKANRDRGFFGEDADEYNPQRAATLEPPAMPWGLSFGGGAHMCIGRRMVTGGDLVGAHSDSNQRGTTGSLLTILNVMLSCGIQPDRSKHWVKDDTTFYDYYISYPVLFTNLNEESVMAITGASE